MNVYMIQNKVNGAVYIGKANEIARRKALHFWRSSNAHLRNAMNRYGREAFEFSVLETFDTEPEAYEQEMWWIAYLRSIGAVLYNIAPGGEGSSGPVSPAARAKISAANTNPSPETLAKRLASRKATSLITHRKISESLKGHIHSPETRMKIGAAGKGRISSPATRAKMSTAAKARWARKTTS